MRILKNGLIGTSTEAVFSKHNSSDSGFGTLAARESATKLYEYGGRVHIAYDTSKGMLTKSGYVNYKGRAIPSRQKLDLGSIGHKNARLKVYGKSGNGYNLNAYKLGAAEDSNKKPKKIFVGFALHGWEDHWRFDGEALVKIGSSVLNKLGNYISANGSLNGWQVCIAPCMNPDGLIAGRTSYGPGRCAVTTGIDLNRCFPTGFSQFSEPRYKTGSTSLGAPEAVALRNLINELSAEASELMVVDCHGWLGFTQGNPDVGKYFTEQFGFTHKTQYSGGFFSTWANSLTNVKGVLLEYPTTTDSFSIVESYATKTYNAIIKMIQSSNGNGGSGSGSGGSGSGNGNIVVGSKVKITGTHWATGQVIPDWAKNTTHTVSRIDGDRALLEEVTSWIYLHDIVLADGGGSGSGNEDVFNKTGKIINVSSVLNVRSGPGTSYSAIGTLKGGDTVTITNRVKPSGESLYWYKIKFGSGTGYIRSDFVALDSNSENTPSESDESCVLRNIKKLEDIARKYFVDDRITHINDLVLEYLRYLKYNGSEWDKVLGPIRSDFVNFIDKNYSTVKKELEPFMLENNKDVQIGKYIVDLPHLAATTLGYTNRSILEMAIPNFWTGWGEDLATGMANVTEILVKNNGKTAEAAANEVIGSSKWSISKVDIEADIDAIYFKEQYKKELLSTAFKNYFYQDNSVKRKNLILNADLELTWPTSVGNINTSIYNLMTGLKGFGHPLAGSKLRNKAIYDDIDPTEAVIKATCLKFSEYIVNM